MTGVSLTAIYVSWRDLELLLGSLERLAATDGVIGSSAIDVIVVINEDTPTARSRIEHAWPGATTISNAVNRGFGPAANQGTQAASGDILLFLNPDTLAVGDPVTSIQRAFAEYPSAVAVAPRLIDTGPATGESQRLFQLRRLPTLRSDARELLLLDRLLPGNRGQRRARYLDVDRSMPFAVEQAAAAALAVRREAFEAIGGFDERFYPAYWEDVDLCRRLGGLGQILHWPDARFEHVGGVSAGELGQARFRQVYYRNAIRYRAKHYSTPALLAYRAMLAIGMLLRMLAVLPTIRGHGFREGLRGFATVAEMALRPLPADERA